MFNVTVNLWPFAEPLSKEAVQSILEDIADAARNHWIKLAGDTFHTASRDYIAGIQPVQMKPGVAVITLVGALPNGLENGMPALDLRKTLLGPNVPVVPVGQRGKHLSTGPDGSKGFYRSIPFRHSVPSSSGTTAPRMGSAYAGHEAVADAKKLGILVYGQAKKLKATLSQPGAGVAYGGRLQAGLAPLLKPHHKSDIYAGMIKERKTYEKATQSQYTTFRTISTRSKEGWIRPATPGRHLAKEVEAFVQKLAPQAFAAYVAEVT